MIINLTKKVNTLNHLSRREFLLSSVVLGSALAQPVPMHGKPAKSHSARPLQVSIFSKHLQFLGVSEMAQAVAEMGFDGVDLSVRPNGHVEPEKAAEQLPLAVEALKKAGFNPLMMTCSVLDAANATDRNVLEIAAKSGFKFYRMNYFHYLEGKSMPESIEYYRERVRKLAALNGKLGITGCYQNHAGGYIGAQVWELYQLVNGVRKEHFGLQYDIRHATVEGGLSWQNGLKLVQNNIATLALKDFRWEKVNNKWQVINCPIGEGMVDFTTFFKMVKGFNLDVPVSLHFEYPLGGAEKGSKTTTLSKETIFKSMRRDLEKIRELWENA